MKRLFLRISKQKVLMMLVILATLFSSFGMRGRASLGPTIYGKLGGQCQALCSTTVGNVCTVPSDDGKFYANSNCATLYAGMRYEIPF